MTSREQANQIAEDAILAAMQCAKSGLGYSNVRYALADEIAKALRTREAETWEQAAQEMEAYKLEIGMVGFLLKPSVMAVNKCIDLFAEKFRARAAQPEVDTK